MCPGSQQSVRQFLAHLPRSPAVHQGNQGVIKIKLYLGSNNTISILCSVIHRGRFGWGESAEARELYCSLLFYFSKKYWQFGSVSLQMSTNKMPNLYINIVSPGVTSFCNSRIVRLKRNRVNSMTSSLG